MLIDVNDAEKYAREHILDARERYTILDFLRECATVDAAPVVHGRWLALDDDSWACSECGAENCYAYSPAIRRFTDKYCPNCGACMDVERR